MAVGPGWWIVLSENAGPRPGAPRSIRAGQAGDGEFNSGLAAKTRTKHKKERRRWSGLAAELHLIFFVAFGVFLWLSFFRTRVAASEPQRTQKKSGSRAAVPRAWAGRDFYRVEAGRGREVRDPRLDVAPLPFGGGV